MFETSLSKKRAVGSGLLVVILFVFLAFNRFPKLDIVQEDLDAVTGPQVECFQGFCIEAEPDSSFLSRWWDFSLTYFELVAAGMVFAFVVAGLTEAFLFPSGTGSWIARGGLFQGTLKGLGIGPVMNLCSACIVPVTSAFRGRGAGIGGTVAMVQGSSTLNLPAILMALVVFTPMLGGSRIVVSVIGGLLIGPLVAMIAGEKRRRDEIIEAPAEMEPAPQTWGEAIREASVAWAKSTGGYVLRIGPIMLIAGLASGLAIQWLGPDTVETYLGNDITGVAIAATLGVLINVPLLFEIPLVVLLLLLGMGVAPAATLLFAAAAGGPVTFWGLARLMPRRAIAGVRRRHVGTGDRGRGGGPCYWSIGSERRLWHQDIGGFRREPQRTRNGARCRPDDSRTESDRLRASQSEQARRLPGTRHAGHAVYERCGDEPRRRLRYLE